MVSAYDWFEYYLLVTVHNRHGQYGYLLNKVDQETFIEHYLEHWPNPRDQPIIRMGAEMLTKEAYDLLEPVFPDEFKLE